MIPDWNPKKPEIEPPSLKNQESETEFQKTREKAEAGLATAQFQMREMLTKYRRTENEYKKARNWYLKSIEQVYIPAYFALGNIFEQRLGVRKDKFKAVKWFEKAPEKGHLLAQFRLGNLLETELKDKVTLGKAIYWYHKAAEQGFALAQFRLGRIYELG